jgi:DNA-binding NarL/FixJ family response regulator
MPEPFTGDAGSPPGSRPIRVLVVDDHALVRLGFRRILDDDPGIAVVGEAGSGAEAIEADRRLDPDVIVMDMAMPEIDGLHAAIEIRRRRPESRILFLSMYSDDQYVKNAFDAGASGYILKNALETDLTRAVRVVAGGGQYLSPDLSSFAIRRMRGEPAEPSDPFDSLSSREKQVLRLIALGKSNKEIASVLGLSANTVAVHRANIMNTLGVHKAAELVLIAVKKGLVEPR